MVVWASKLDLMGVFHNDGLSFAEMKEIITNRIVAASWYDVDVLGLIVFDLQFALDEDEFNSAWDQFYDWADENSVWVETW